MAERTSFETQLAVLDALQRAFERRDADAIAALFHPAANLKLLTTPNVVKGRDGTLGYMKTIEQRMIAASFHSIEPVGDEAVLVVGRLQRQGADKSLTDTPAAWLVSFRDGLISRAETFTDEAEARMKAATLTSRG